MIIEVDSAKPTEQELRKKYSEMYFKKAKDVLGRNSFNTLVNKEKDPMRQALFTPEYWWIKYKIAKKIQERFLNLPWIETMDPTFENCKNYDDYIQKQKEHETWLNTISTPAPEETPQQPKPISEEEIQSWSNRYLITNLYEKVYKAKTFFDLKTGEEDKDRILKLLFESLPWNHSAQEIKDLQKRSQDNALIELRKWYKKTKSQDYKNIFIKYGFALFDLLNMIGLTNCQEPDFENERPEDTPFVKYDSMSDLFSALVGLMRNDIINKVRSFERPNDLLIYDPIQYSNELSKHLQNDLWIMKKPEPTIFINPGLYALKINRVDEREIQRIIDTYWSIL
jgi:hypothetical protein